MRGEGRGWERVCIDSTYMLSSLISPIHEMKVGLACEAVCVDGTVHPLSPEAISPSTGWCVAANAKFRSPQSQVSVATPPL